MVKLIIDDLTGKVYGYTRVMGNTSIYKGDVLVEGSELAKVGIEDAYWIGGKLCKSPEDEYHLKLAALDDEIEQAREESSKGLIDYLMAGKTVKASVSEMKKNKEKVQGLKEKKDEMEAEHRRHLETHYLEQNRKADESLSCRYYSAVILLIKDENRYLKEWLDWHLNIGFDHIYIYDNGTKDHVQDIVDDYAAETQQRITVIDWTGHHNHIQQDAYNHFMEHFKVDVRWGLFIDSDEFLRFTDDKIADVNMFLKAYEDYTEVWGYEVEYDANGQETYEDKPVRERFTRRTDTREGFYWKNFIQVNRIDSFLMHYAYYDPAKHQVFKNEQSNQDLFVIDHFYTKSWEEWCWKIRERGGADPNYHKELREFFYYNPDMKHLDTGESAVQSYE